jgi:phosphoglycolate phosphatase
MKAPQPVFSAVLCDLDGTLIDSRWDIAAAFQHALRLVTGDTPVAAGIIRHIGKPLEHMLRALGYALSTDQLSAFFAAYRHHYTRHGLTHTQPFPDVAATLQRLSATALGVVTTKAQEQAEMVLQHLELARFFRHIQGWQPGLQLKPAPDSIFVALEALHCPPAQALMVGDTPADVLAGKAAGVTTCAVTYGYSPAEELQQCMPDYLIDSFSELLPLVSEGTRWLGRGDRV